MSTNDEQHGKEVVVSASKRFTVGKYGTIGPRPTMEDSLVIAGAFMGEEDMDYFAVFDGHGGSKVSHIVADQLHKEIGKQLGRAKSGELTNEEMVTIFHDAFSKLDQKITDSGVESGSTGIVSLIIKDTIFCANAGDSRAVLCSGDRAVRLSRDHKPDLPDETKRIEEAGGFVVQRPGNIPRINGRLAVSRAFGDSDLGESVSASPFVSIFDLAKMRISFVDTAIENKGGEKDLAGKLHEDRHDLFLILACDGLWDVFQDEEVAHWLYKHEGGKEDLNKVAEALVNAALKKGTQDNVSVIIIKLSGHGKDKK
eukprot:TRINITY_DN566_c0_g1_i1.p1 TRINITY_DN566_c0_g1~~TRINITY_DN566_c0_g1_i1.p1  ORF type:complete len:333 (-),score=100.62 TRINITY_DN566_c0_g1_i1:38-973(-)